jgi:hypothetical protein
MNLIVIVAPGSEVLNGALPITNSSDSNDGNWDKGKPTYSILVHATVVERVSSFALARFAKDFPRIAVQRIVSTNSL